MAVLSLPFDLAVEHACDAVFVLELSGGIVWANRAAEEATGRPVALLRGQEFSRMLTPRSADAAEPVLRALHDNNSQARPLQLEFIRTDLTAFPMEFNFSRDANGSGAIVAIGRDTGQRQGLAEERKRAEFQTLQFQATLVELARTEAAAIEDSLSHIAAVAAAALDVARVGIWLFNDARTELRCVLSFDRKKNTQESGAVLEVTKFPRYFEALEESRTVAVREAGLDPQTAELAEYLTSLNITSMLDVPIRREGRTIGVICHEETGEPRDWRLDERNFAASLADLTALVLETDRRRKAELQLRSSLDQLELFFSQSLDGFFFMMMDEPVRWDDSVDKEQVLDYIFEHQSVTKANDAVLGQYGASWETFLGMRPCDLFAHDLEHGRDLWRRMLDAGRLHVESDERRADGTPMWVEGDYICFHDSEGRVTGHFGIQRDITQRKEAERALRRFNKRLTLLQHTDRGILSARSVTEIAGAALAHVHELVPCRRASVAEFDLATGRARLIGVHSLMQTCLGVGSEMPIEAFGRVEDLRRGKSELVPNIEFVAPSPIRDRLQAEGIRSFVRVPLLAERELIGALNLSSDVVAAFSLEHVEILQEVADSLSVAIRHAQLNQQLETYAASLERRVAERTAELSQANASLRESEERLASIFRSAMDAILVIDAEREIVIFNHAAEKMFRCGTEQAVGRRIDDFLTDELSQLLQNYISGANAQDAPQLWVPDGHRALRRDGERFPIEATISRTELGVGTLFTLILRDINERKQAEEKLEQLSRQNIYLQQEIQTELNFEEIVGASAAMQRVFNSIEMVAATDSTVLLLGETGTGKELIARAVHNRSRRRQNVMVKVNCAALPANLVESELFGHEKGAFTGAFAQKKGRFELANRGTIFLDEVGELPLETQTRLLRVLQEQEFERVGGWQTLKVDVRVIAATNRDLAEEVKRGTFRADLYYRLNVFPIDVPPLRIRKDDIPLLASYFVRKFSERMNKRIQSISREAHEQMQRYNWPGNVRELANLMERAVILCQGTTLKDSHIAVAGPPPAAAAAAKFPTLEESERNLIIDALARTNGVLAGPNGAANLLGLNRSTLWSRMKKLNIELPKAKSTVAGVE